MQNIWSSDGAMGEGMTRQQDRKYVEINSHCHHHMVYNRGGGEGVF